MILRAASPAAQERRRVRAPVLTVAGLAWLAVLLLPWADRGPMPGADRTAPPMVGHAAMGTAGDFSLPGFLGMWSLMVTAMMAPLLIGPHRHLGSRSLPRHHAAVRALFLVGYATVWSVAGLILLAAAHVLDWFGPAGPLAVGVAALWQFGPDKQRYLNLHQICPPLPAFGWRAELAALRFGVRRGLACVGSCWALMLLPLAVPAGQLAVMVAVTLWIWAEQLEFPRVATWRIRVPTRALLILWATMRSPRLATTG
jgi:predicted metal-binding membrane protein